MKRILSICLLILLLCGCSRMSQKYPFKNQGEAIESIELLYYPWYEDESKPFMEFETIRTLSNAEIPGFMNELYALETKKATPTPPGNYGAYIARVNYKNGDSEYFGTMHIEFVANGEKPFAVGYYYFPGNQFDELFFKYVDKAGTDGSTH